jgi:hypothetical protein
MFYWAMENNEFSSEVVELESMNAEYAVELATRYAPEFVFSTDGRFPVAAQTYPGKGVMYRGPRYLAGIFDPVVYDFSDATENPPVENTADTYISQIPRKLDAARWRPPVYYRVVKVEDVEKEIDIVIQYWLLFQSEEAPFPRSGDWQMVALYFDKSHSPLYVTGTLTWNADVARFKELVPMGDTIRIHCGEASNAMFLSPGEHTLYLDSEFVFPWGSDMAARDVILSPESDYRLVMLDGSEPWLLWQGRWGGPQPGGDRGPRYWNPKSGDLSPWSYPSEFLRFYKDK